MHIKGYLRRRENGSSRPVVMPGFVVVQGPGDLVVALPGAADFEPAASTGHSRKPSSRPAPTALTSKTRRRCLGARLLARRRPTACPPSRSAPRAGQGAARPGVRRVSHRDLLRRRQGGRPAGRVARHRSSRTTGRRRSREGFFYSSDAPLLAHGTLRVVAARSSENDTTDEEGGASLALESGDRADRPAAQLRRRGDRHRRRRPDRHQRPAPGHRAAALRARREGAALRRARARSDRARDHGRGRRRSSSSPARTSRCGS